MDKIYQDLLTYFPTTFIKQNYPLAPITTLKIGGPADIYIQTTSQPEFIKLLKFLSTYEIGNQPSQQFLSAQRTRTSIKDRGSPKVASTAKIRSQADNNIPITILGNASNVLISDSGIRGIVIKNSSSSIKILSKTTKTNFSKTDTHRTENEPEKYLDFSKIDYDESGFPQIKVQISSGTSLPHAINYLLDKGITGLQWFAYIPGTIGGAIVHNAHGGSYHISDYLINVKVFNLATGKTIIYSKSKLPWQYQTSYFLNHPQMIILSANFNLFLGDVNRAKLSRDAWIAQKSKVQPVNSAGSVFANPPLDICQKIWGEQKSTGWIIDHELNLKGYKIGGAQISPLHANFIVNNGSATSKDYLSLIKLVQNQAKSKFGFDLKHEIKLLGSF